MSMRHTLYSIAATVLSVVFFNRLITDAFSEEKIYYKRNLDYENSSSEVENIEEKRTTRKENFLRRTSLTSTTAPKHRRAVIHIGPPKTATTTIQFAMKKDASHFAADGYLAKGPFHEFASCLNTLSPHYAERCTKKIDDYVLQVLDEAAQNFDHLFVSSECFGKENDVLPNLASALAPWDEVTIVITYRRFFEWLASKYNQYFRTLDQPLTKKGELYPSMVEYYTPQKIKYLFESRYVNGFYEIYSDYFSDVILFNIHDTTDLVSDFYCTVIPEAETACEVAKARAEAAAEDEEHENHTHSSLNKSVALDYDRLVRAAYRAGLLGEDVTLQEALDAVVYRQETILEASIHDLPLVCMSGDTLDMILDMSLEAERTFFPDWFASPFGEDDLRARFESATLTKLCNVDVNRVLEDEGWRDFFRSLPMQIS